VCRCLRDATVRQLQALLAEHVTDPASRARLTAAWGFCAAHAAALRDVPDAALGVAIVYHGLVTRARAWLAGATPPARGPGARPGWRALLGRRPAPAPPVRRRARCVVCAELPATERGYLETLAAGLGEPELGAAFAGSRGLCLPHVELALAAAADPADAARLVAATRARLEQLAADLQGFIDKHDHRVRPRFTEREAEAWSAALALVAGAPERFGPGVPAAVDGPGRPAGDPGRSA
jgi:hypothetical protein